MVQRFNKSTVKSIARLPLFFLLFTKGAKLSVHLVLRGVQQLCTALHHISDITDLDVCSGVFRATLQQSARLAVNRGAILGPRMDPLIIALVIACFGQVLMARTDNPEIVFNGLYHVVFPGNFLSRFHQCLCDDNVKSCSVDYELDSNLGYPYGYRVTDVDVEDLESGGQSAMYGAAYQCHPGQFGAEGEIICTKLKTDDAGCRGWTTSSVRNSVCLSFSLPTTEPRCYFSCVDVLWSGFFVKYKHFPSAEQPKPESCLGSTGVPDMTTATTVTTVTTTTTSREVLPESTSVPNRNSSQSAGPGVSMKTEDDGDGDGSLALGVGIGCAFIVVLVVVFVAAFVLWRRKRNRNASHRKPTLPFIPHLHSNNAYQASQAGREKRKFSTGENGGEYAAYLEPVHIYSHVTGEEEQAVVYENIDAIERKESLKRDGVKASNGSHVGPTRTGAAFGSSQHEAHPYDVASSVDSSAPDPYNKKKKKHGKKDNGGNGKKKGGPGEAGDLSHDYNRLHTGRSGKGAEVSRSILARYNNPPTPPSAPNEDDSIYEGYEEDWQEDEGAVAQEASMNAYSMATPPDEGAVAQEASMNAYSMATPTDEGAVAQEASMNAYSMATPTDAGEAGRADQGTNSNPSNQAPNSAGKSSAPYENLNFPAALGILNPGFSPDDPQNSNQDYLVLREDAENAEEGEGISAENANKSIVASDSDPPNVYFELEKDPDL
ncbi:hypothetical protein RRG08_061668 [Elysia crispata]|uniref:Uncharacterized protein n=1 Tax=Elysia crispata TaxID=231223 RepID=A0AAE1D9F8_9GAST|nr:hypothetical protein RRG08_061668 [Elysia crispata]